MVQTGAFKQKKILLVDQAVKNQNDRTWCFWEKEESLFQSIVYKEWKQLFFYSQSLTKALEIEPYTYKLIRGIDFYSYCLEEVKKHLNIDFVTAPVDALVSKDDETYIVAQGKRYDSKYIFNSILFDKPLLKQKQYWLLQHFSGWLIQTETSFFDSSVGTLMDFRTDQSRGTCFFYVLPFSATKALVEYTVFSKELLEETDYKKALANYIAHELNIDAYTIQEKEFGIIPMTNYPFQTRRNNIINIGTAGGQTKGSSGYTFQFIQKSSAAIVKGLLYKQDPAYYLNSKKRFEFYDSVLLNILHRDKMQGNQIFSELFKHNKASDVLTFLDNETSLQQELKIIRSLPTTTFLKAAINHVTPL